MVSEEKLFPSEYFYGGNGLPGCVDRLRSYMDGTYVDGLDTERSGRITMYQSWYFGVIGVAEPDLYMGITWAVCQETLRRIIVRTTRPARRTPEAILGLVSDEFERFGGRRNVRAVILDDAAADILHNLQLEVGTNVPLMGGRTTSNGDTNSPSIAAVAELHRNGRIRYPYRTDADRATTDAIAHKMGKWPNHAGDDGELLAMFIAERLFGKMRLPGSSPLGTEA